MSLKVIISGWAEYSDLEPWFNSDSELEKGEQIIDAEPSVTIATIKVQLAEPKELEEGEKVFHS